MYYFVETAGSIPVHFADCLGGILSVSAKDLKLRLSTAEAGARAHFRVCVCLWVLHLCVFIHVHMCVFVHVHMCVFVHVPYVFMYFRFSLLLPFISFPFSFSLYLFFSFHSSF